MSVGCSVVVLVGTVLVLYLGAQPVEGGCVELGYCCHGKNNTCLANGPRINNPKSHKCFCDESCVFQKDCCTDYRDLCKAQHCELGPWSRWGECSKDCGWGQKTRERLIKTHPKNGGKACEATQEKVFCYGWSCKSARHSHGSLEMRETGKVIPAMYGNHRRSKKYSPFADIRRNLFNHYSANKAISRPPYCARFEVTSTHHACDGHHATDWSRLLKKGSQVCVECQPLAMKRKLGIRCKGHGVFHKETRWTAATVSGCHGKWVMKTEHEDCSCNPQSQSSFILLWEPQCYFKNRRFHASCYHLPQMASWQITRLHYCSMAQRTPRQAQVLWIVKIYRNNAHVFYEEPCWLQVSD